MMIRLIALASFLSGQVALLYFAGFLRNWTPWGVDTAPGLAAGGILGDIVLLAVFGISHSLLARPAVKRRLFGRLQGRVARSVYNLVAAGTLGLLMGAWTPLPATLWHCGPGPVATVLDTVYWAGWALLAIAVCAIDVWHMFGLRQAFARNDADPPFSMRGPYRFVRHPIQLGFIAVMWATPHMTAGHALLAGALTGYSILATLALEEADLRRQLGQVYVAYSRQVPALLPRLFGRPPR